MSYHFYVSLKDENSYQRTQPTKITVLQRSDFQTIYTSEVPRKFVKILFFKNSDGGLRICTCVLDMTQWGKIKQILKKAEKATQMDMQKRVY